MQILYCLYRVRILTYFKHVTQMRSYNRKAKTLNFNLRYKKRRKKVVNCHLETFFFSISFSKNPRADYLRNPATVSQSSHRKNQKRSRLRPSLQKNSIHNSSLFLILHITSKQLVQLTSRYANDGAPIIVFLNFSQLKKDG